MKPRSAVRVATALMVVLLAVSSWALTQGPPTPNGDFNARGEVIPIRNGSVVTYLLARDGAPLVLINSGDDPSAEAILKELSRIGRKASDVVAVILTHGSYDHYAAVEHFPKATVYASSDDLNLVDHVRRIGSTLPRIRMRLFGRPPRPRSMRTVLAGERLSIGPWRLDCIGLPGVTRESLACRYGDTVFVGDSVWPDGDGLAIPSRLWLEDPNALRSSLPRLDRLEAQWLATSRAGLIEKPEKVAP